ncbi:MAG: MoaD/ThiS family protein [Flavobacteriales bacterium]|nr:MoaD/ThiS family protein [Flavobacteriales bacterium]
MILKLKYFGMIAEAIGKSEELLDFSGKTILDLDVVLKSNTAKLSSMNYKFAVNQSLVEHDEMLINNDEIALLPPFAGG